MLIHRPTTSLRSSGNNSTTVHMNNNRPKSAKHKLFIKTNKVGPTLAFILRLLLTFKLSSVVDYIALKNSTSNTLFFIIE